MVKSLILAFLVATTMAVSLPLTESAYANSNLVQLADNGADVAIQPSEAANIARNAYGDAKVLNVKLLPNGVYAVTLKIGGSVTRVMVDATTGAVN